MNSLDALLKSSAAGLENLSGLSARRGDGDGGADFSDILSDAFDLAESRESRDKGSILSLLTGEVNDISEVLIDSEKSKIALSLTIEIRNKMLEAYNEMMNMQV
jgi:flagellar hook-basal body complex protein FliE